MKCEYGCGCEATYFFKSTKKWGCSKNINSCAGKCERDRIKKKGKNPFANRIHPKPRTGCTPPNKGKSLEETYGYERAEEIRKKMSNSMKGTTGWSKIDPETLKRIKDDASKRAYKRHASGWQGAIGRCKKINYISKIAGEVLLDGGWELLVAQYLDKNNIQWERNKKRFQYTYEGKQRFYTPDFYIKEKNIYIEVKGYETNLDKEKWKQFPEAIEIWKKEKINLIRKEMEG